MNESEKQKNGPDELNIDIEKDGWHVNKQLISTVGIGLVVKPSNGTRGEESKRQLKELLNIIKELSIHADFITPLIVGIKDDEGNKDDKDIFRNYQRDQNWHRGNFLICPNFDKKDLKKILHPEKPDFNYTPKILTIKQVKKSLKDSDIGDIKDIIIKNLDEEDINWKTILEEWIYNKTDYFDEGIENSSTKKFYKKYDEHQKYIDRITNIDIKYFKGIKELDIDLDADIILITGPNGHGKSSFVEALTLVLTGYHPELDNNNKNNKYVQEKNIYTDVPTHFLFYNENQFTITLKDNNTNEYKVIGSNEDKTITIPNNLYIYREQKRKQTDDRILRFRLTSFLPDYIKLIFDENIGNSNKQDRKSLDLLIDIFTDIPEQVKKLSKTIENVQKDVENNIVIDSYIDDIHNWLKDFIKIINSILSYKGKDKLKYTDDIDLSKNRAKDIYDLLDNVKKELKKSFDYDSFEYSSLKNFTKKLESFLGQSSATEIRQLEKNIDNLKKELKQLNKEIIEYQEKGYQKELSIIGDILDKLSNKKLIKRCIDTLKEYSLNDIVKELEIIDKDKASLMKRSIDFEQQKLLSSIKEKRDKKEKEIKEKEEELDRLKQAEFKTDETAQRYIKKYKKIIKDNSITIKKIAYFEKTYKEIYSIDFESLLERNEQLKKLQEFLHKEKEKILSGDFNNYFEKLINKILKRFAMTPGLNEVEITENFKVKAKEAGVKDIEDKDKRDLNCFSLGQRAQIALAWMITSRELVQNCKSIKFPHRALILDDPTSSFDMTNLLSNALLCRQLAYHPDPKQRYQIFIVSHNEEFTSKLLDLLCPPGKDLKMKLIRFDDWTPDKGAKTKEFEVEPAPKDMEKAREAFEKGLKYFKELL